MVKASLEQLRQVDREERHAWRLVDRAADEAGCSAVTRTSLRTSRAESALQQQKRVEKWTNSPLSQNSPLSHSSPLRIRVADVEVLARALVSAVIKLSRPLKENERVQEKVRPTPSPLLKEISTEEFGDVCQTAQFHVCLRREVEARIQTGTPLP